MDASDILRAGGIASSKAEVPKDLRVAPVDARVFEHPALPGRKVVRLVAAPIAPGVDVEMETLGFEKREVREGLGKQRYRALGFPGWPLVHDPARAKFALEVMKDFKKAAQQAKSKPGHARDAFVAIGDRLARSVPHFLPSFWEEAGRVFLAEDSASFAAQCFEKARSAEKEHKLEVDEDVRSAVYLEFALGGAVAAKSLAGYAKELAEAYGAKDAYERFLELAIRRVLGGMQPWTGVAKDLRALAKAAKLDVDQEDRRFLAEVIDAPAMVRAPGEFWTSYRASLVALCKESKEKPAVRTRLRHLFPKPSSGTQGFPASWLSLLEEAGALAGVIDANDTAAEPKGGAAQWLGKLLQFLERQADALPLIEKCAPRLVAEGEPLALAPAQHWRCNLDLDVTERALALKLPVADPPPAAAFNLLQAFSLDPVHVEADSRFSGKLLDAVENVLGNREFEERARGKVGLGKARSSWLARELDRLCRGALPGLARTTERLAEKASAQLFSEMPGALDKVETTDVAAALARTLRGGLFAELTWPIFEETWPKLQGAITIVGSYPHPILKTATKVVVLGADRVLMEHDLVLPAKAQVHHVVYADGDLLVPFWAQDQGGLRAYWASNPHDPFTLSGYFHWYGDDLPTSVDLEGGGTSFGHRAIKKGDREVQPGFRHIATDGQTIWYGEWSDGRWVLKEMDPRTGNGGRASWPKFAEAASAKDDGLRITSVALAPLPNGMSDSILGSKGGLTGAVMRGPKHGEGGKLEVETIDGRRWEGHTNNGAAPVALLKWPGDEKTPRALLVESVWQNGRSQVVRIVGEDGVVASSLRQEAWASRGWPQIPPLSLWSFLRTRDEKGSHALRKVDTEKAKRLLDAATKETDAKAMTATRAAIKQVLPEITADPLAEAVAAACLEAAERAKKVEGLVAQRRAPAAEVSSSQLLDKPVLDALATFVSTHWSNSLLSDELVAVSRALVEGGDPTFKRSNATWHDWIGRIRGIALLAASPAISDEARRALVDLLQLWRGTPLARDGKFRKLLGAVAASSPVRPKEGPSWIAHYEKSHYFFRVLTNNTDVWNVTAVEHATDGTFRLPPGVTLTFEATVTIAGDEAWLDRFLALLAEKGPRAFSAAEVEAIAKATGLTRPEATLVVAGFPKMNEWGADFLGKEVREKLGGLKTADAKIARETFKSHERWKLLAVLAAAAPDDPAEIWADLSSRYARGWNEGFGQRAPMREDLLLSVERDLDPSLTAATLLGALKAPKESSVLAVKELTLEELFAWSNPPKTDCFRHDVAESLAGFIPWMFHSLPVGDPDRGLLPALHAAIVAVLSDARLILPLATGYVEEKQKAALKTLIEAIGGKTDPIKIGNEQSLVARDGGAVVGAIVGNGHQARLAFRPSQVGESGFAHSVAQDTGLTLHRYTALHAISFLRSPGVASMMKRIANTPVPEGGWEANPAASCASLVDEVVSKTKLSREAATHYLQLLAMAEPTMKNVTTWNGWKTGLYKETCIELTKQKLVVEGKRERASREVFLPGGWDKASKSKNLPTETWKKPLYALPSGAPLARVLPLRPHHELFEAAWKRVVGGDAPKFEEV